MIAAALIVLALLVELAIVVLVAEVRGQAEEIRRLTNLKARSDAIASKSVADLVEANERMTRAVKLCGEATRLLVEERRRNLRFEAARRAN